MRDKISLKLKQRTYHLLGVFLYISSAMQNGDITTSG